MMLLEHGDAAIAIDCGLMFPGADLLGIDLVIPDVSYLMEKKSRLKGIVLSHAHEDHVGALPYFLNHLSVPIFGTRLTLGLITTLQIFARLLRVNHGKLHRLKWKESASPTA